jgi:hypothetical protein
MASDPEGIVDTLHRLARTSGLRSCQVRVVFMPPAAARSQLPA